MDASDIFDHQLLLFNGVAICHMARCLDAANVLDETAKRSFRAHFTNLSEAAEETGEDAVLAYIDTMVRQLPFLAE